MSRIYTSANDPLDFCRKCFPNEQRALIDYGDVGDGPDGRGNCFDWDSDHPSYDETDYTCTKCNKKLNNKDNHLPL